MNIPYTKAKHAEMKVVEGGGTSLELLSIYIDTPPDKTEYAVEDTFTLEGLKVIATYSDDYYKDVTEYVTSSIQEGYEFTEEDEGDETVTLSYTQDGVTKTASFGIEIASEITLSYNVYLNSSIKEFSSSGFEQHHRINVKGIKTISISGTFKGRRTSSGSSVTEQLFLRAVYSTNEFAEGGSYSSIESYSIAPSSTSWVSKVVSNTIDVDEVFSQYEDKENCYIDIYKKDGSYSSTQMYADLTCTLIMKGKDLTLLTNLVHNENSNHYVYFEFGSADMLEELKIKSKVDQTYSYNLYRLRQYGYLKTGSRSYANGITYSSTGVKEEAEWSILSSDYDMTKAFRIIHDASSGDTASTTGGTTKYKITLA